MAACAAAEEAGTWAAAVSSVSSSCCRRACSRIFLLSDAEMYYGGVCVCERMGVDGHWKLGEREGIEGKREGLRNQLFVCVCVIESKAVFS